MLPKYENDAIAKHNNTARAAAKKMRTNQSGSNKSPNAGRGNNETASRAQNRPQDATLTRLFCI